MQNVYSGQRYSTKRFFITIGKTASEFNEFEPRLKSAKNRFQSSAGLNLEKLNTILSEPTRFESWLKFKPRPIL